MCIISVHFMESTFLLGLVKHFVKVDTVRLKCNVRYKNLPIKAWNSFLSQVSIPWLKEWRKYCRCHARLLASVLIRCIYTRGHECNVVFVLAPKIYFREMNTLWCIKVLNENGICNYTCPSCILVLSY